MKRAGSSTPGNSAGKLAGIASEVSGLSCVKYLDDIQLSDALLSGSIKNAAVIACSDMGCSIPYLCSSANVQLFLFQNFGHGFRASGLEETILMFGVENVIVYGHSACEYTKFIAESVRGRATNNEALTSELEQEQLQLYSACLESEEQKPWEELARFNVLFELKNMLCDPLIASLAEQGSLKLHGWFYNSANKQLEIFDPKIRVFTTATGSFSERSLTVQ